MKKFGVSFLILFLPCIIFAQAAQKVSLLVANCKAGEDACRTRQLFRYDFIGGELVGKEEIVSSQSLIFDEWRDRIYRNRYVVTASGDVVDVAAKKVLFESPGEFHRFEGDKIYIRQQKFPEGLYAFDLLTGKYSKVRRTDKSMLFGNLSPNGLRSVSYWCEIDRPCSFRINEYAKSGIRLEYKSSVIKSGDLSTFEIWEPPVYWLDDERFITQKNNGVLVIISTKGTVTPFVNIKIDEYPRYNPRILLNTDGELIYQCVNDYALDLETRTFRRIDGALGNGFSFKLNDAVKRHWDKIFYFDKTEIGRLWAYEPRTTEGFLAVAYKKDRSNLAYPDGVKVWNKFKNDWTTLEIEWGAKIIGWIKE